MPRIARAAAVAVTTWLVARAPALNAAPAPAQVDSCGDSGAAAWKALEAGGGVVPEIDEDRTQAPPGWWRYPGPRRSAVRRSPFHPVASPRLTRWSRHSRRPAAANGGRRPEDRNAPSADAGAAGRNR